ncbi:hypothetical protein ZWY2020_040107 [Hordeum vulgare]|nr:hypothetical protein ZWY2020_040107 [Hordeum vulgare]
MSLKQICFVSVFFSDDEDEPADPNIILEEPSNEASKSDKDRILPTSTVRLPRKRCGRTRASKLGWGIAVSAVGVTEDVLVQFIVGYDILMDCWERALRSAAQMVPYEVSIGLILVMRLVSTFGSAKAITRIFRNPT